MTTADTQFEPTFLVLEVGGQPNNARQIYFSEPMAYPVLITELHAAWFDGNVAPVVQVSLTDTSYAPMWTTDDVPARSILLESNKASNALLLPAPFLLTPGNALQLEIYNGDAVGFQSMTTITARGARVLEGDSTDAHASAH